MSVHGELVTEMVQNVVGGCVEMTSVGENQMGGDEEIRDVFGGDVAGDWLVAAGGAVVLEKSLVVDWINPHELENSLAEGGVGGAEVG